MARPNFQPQPATSDRETWRNFLRVRDTVTGIDTRTASLESTVAALQAAVSVLQNVSPEEGVDVDVDPDTPTATALYSGETELAFGGAPGSNTAERTVGATWVTSDSIIMAWVPGHRSTADNNATEHWFVPITVKVTAIDPGVSFTLTAYSDPRLQGNFVVHWQGR